MLALPWQSEPRGRALCSVPHNKHGAQTLLVSRASKEDKEEGTKNLTGILLCHRHEEIVCPELTKLGKEGMETGDEERTGEGSGGIFPGRS